jgi:hypothetical protein
MGLERFTKISMENAIATGGEKRSKHTSKSSEDNLILLSYLDF